METSLNLENQECAASLAGVSSDICTTLVLPRCPGIHDEPGRLGHYELQNRLGHGGMGVVYAAYDMRLERRVAIKLLHEHGDPIARRRLLGEARALARLSHPNIVQVHEIGEHGLRCFIAMELVDGPTLDVWLRAEPRSQSQILEVLTAAGRGLAAAHAEGLLHRDLKPTNIMVGCDGRVRIVDFGLAQDVGGSPTPRNGHRLTEASEQTGPSRLLGTPAYMAPEQFQGQGLDAQTDQFSFCVTLWEALQGSRPFEGSTLARLSAAVTAGHIAEVESSELSPRLLAIIERGLAVDPEQRWPSVDRLLDAIEDTLRAKPQRPRRQFIKLAAAAAMFVAGVGLGRSEDRVGAFDTRVAEVPSLAMLEGADVDHGGLASLTRARLRDWTRPDLAKGEQEPATLLSEARVDPPTEPSGTETPDASRVVVARKARGTARATRLQTETVPDVQRVDEVEIHSLSRKLQAPEPLADHPDSTTPILGHGPASWRDLSGSPAEAGEALHSRSDTAPK